MKLTETQGAYAAHPLGGCRMADRAGPRRHRPPRRRLRLRGPLLHRRLDHPDLARRQPVADHRRGERALRREAGRPRRRPRPAAPPARVPSRDPRRDRRRARRAQAGAPPQEAQEEEGARVKRIVATLVLCAAAWSVAATGTAAPGDVTGWNGVNPFHCDLQQAGFDPVGPAPDADPYCVEFDKRRQNVTELGVVEFLSLEPARVAAAGPKCFYFQSDHWRGSIVQDDGSTKTYEWDGHYFFDKAKGDGGAWVTNFNVNGQTRRPVADPRHPAGVRPVHGPGHRRRDHPQRHPRRPELRRARRRRPAAHLLELRAPADHRWEGRRLSLRARRHRERSRRARSRSATRSARCASGWDRRSPSTAGFLRYCLRGGGRLMVGELEDRSGELGESPDARVVLLLTTSPVLATKGLAAGDRAIRGAPEVPAGAAPLHRRPHERAGASAAQWADRGRSPGPRALAGRVRPRGDSLEAGSALAVGSPAVAARCMR